MSMNLTPFQGLGLTDLFRPHHHDPANPAPAKSFGRQLPGDGGAGRIGLGFQSRRLGAGMAWFQDRRARPPAERIGAFEIGLINDVALPQGS